MVTTPTRGNKSKFITLASLKTLFYLTSRETLRLTLRTG